MELNVSRYLQTTCFCLYCSLGYPCPMNFNPADYFVHTLAIVPGDEERCKDRVKVNVLLLLFLVVLLFLLYTVLFCFFAMANGLTLFLVHIIWHAQEMCDAYKEHEAETTTKEDVGFNKGLCTKQVTYGTKSMEVTLCFILDL